MKFDQKYITLRGIKKFSHRFQNFIFESRYFAEWWLFTDDYHWLLLSLSAGGFVPSLTSYVTLFRHWFHQLVIFHNNVLLITLQINTCFKSAMKILGESTKVLWSKIEIKISSWFRNLCCLLWISSIPVFRIFIASFNPNKAGLFEGSFSWEGGVGSIWTPLRISRRTYPISI